MQGREEPICPREMGREISNPVAKKRTGFIKQRQSVSARSHVPLGAAQPLLQQRGCCGLCRAGRRTTSSVASGCCSHLCPPRRRVAGARAIGTARGAGHKLMDPDVPPGFSPHRCGEAAQGQAAVAKEVCVRAARAGPACPQRELGFPINK